MGNSVANYQWLGRDLVYQGEAAPALRREVFPSARIQRHSIGLVWRYWMHMMLKMNGDVLESAIMASCPCIAVCSQLYHGTLRLFAHVVQVWLYWIASSNVRSHLADTLHAFNLGHGGFDIRRCCSNCRWSGHVARRV